MSVAGELFLEFALLSFVAFGGATALLPEMHRVVVENHHWLDDTTFTHLYAIAQAAPGPNVLVVTLIGWKVAGLAGALAPGHAWRDAAVHALALGFVFAMVFGHAPIIFPAVARVKIPYHPAFYLPLLLLRPLPLRRPLRLRPSRSRWRQTLPPRWPLPIPPQPRPPRPRVA